EAVTGSDVTPRQGAQGITVRLNSLAWARLFAQFGEGHDRHLPTQYMSANAGYLQGLFDGLLDSDGQGASDGRIHFQHTSGRLVELFTVLCCLLKGRFPSSEPVSHGADGPTPSATERRRAGFRSRLSLTGEPGRLGNYLVVRRLGEQRPGIA